MKELELNNKSKIEVSVKQKKQIEYQLVGKIIPFQGHKIWEINNETEEIDEAKFAKATYHLFGEFKKEVIKKQGYTYVSALNKKNALKKYKQGVNGSQPILEKLFTF